VSFAGSFLKTDINGRSQAMGKWVGGEHKSMFPQGNMRSESHKSCWDHLIIDSSPDFFSPQMSYTWAFPQIYHVGIAE
jgi:hypothetical protein